MARVVILGAGLTGISTAYHLEQLGFDDFAIFERSDSVGGLCRSREVNGFTFDYTGHLLHINDDYFRDLIDSVAGFSDFLRIKRNSYIYSHGHYTRYPFQINLYGLPPEVIADCVEGFVTRPTGGTSSNFKQWAIQSFGTGIVKHFFEGYQSKLFAYPIDEITPSWVGRFVPVTSLRDMVIGAVQDRVSEAIGYNASFLYPMRGGINYWVSKFAKKVRTRFHTGMEVSRVNLRAKRIEFDDGSVEPFDVIVNTVPLDDFLRMVVEPSDSNLHSASGKLLCNSVANLNLGFLSPEVKKTHWVYFSERTYEFYRVGFPHNFSPFSVPEGCSSLYAEISFLQQEPNLVKERIRRGKKQLKNLLGIREGDVLVEHLIYLKHAYVIYNKWRDANLDKILKRLLDYKVLSTGRFGAWKYSSMQEAVLDGREAARQVLGEIEAGRSFPSQLDKDYFRETI